MNFTISGLSRKALLFAVLIMTTSFGSFAMDDGGKKDAELLSPPAAASKMQNPMGIKVDLNLKNATIVEFISALQKQTGNDALFNLELTSQLKALKNITVVQSNATVESVLKSVLPSIGLTYGSKDKAIIISKAPTDSSQDKNLNVFGSVVDEKGKPIIGASVIIEGSTKGAITDSKGYFVLSVKPNQNLVFSFVGMKPQTITVKEDMINVVIKLVSDEIEVEDVIVTGYGTINKESFTGSTTTITKEDILKVSPTNVFSALQVFDPSLRMVVNNDMGSDPNTLPEFYVRGQSGISGVSELDIANGEVSEYSLQTNPNIPIFILDGFEISIEKLYDMDPNRISTMTILKDAASTAIYGSRAANGVIVIETVAPTPGKLNVTYTFTGSITAPDLSSYNLMNAEEKIATELAAGLLYENTDATASSDDYYKRYTYYRNIMNNIEQGVDTYWLSQPLTTQFNQNHSINVESGNEVIRFNIAARYGRQNGVMKGSMRENVGADFKVDYRMSSKLQFSNMVSFDNNNSEDSPYGSFSDYVAMQPYWSPYDLQTGELISDYSTYYTTVYNPLYIASLDGYSRSNYYQFIDNFQLNYTINNYLRLKAQVAISYKHSGSDSFIDPDNTEYYKTFINDSYYSERGQLTLTSQNELTTNTNLLLYYNRLIGEHSINVSLGANTSTSKSDYTSEVYKGFVNGSMSDPKYASDISTKPTFDDNITRLAGAFLTANYTYKNIYLVDLSARLDGSSEFGNDTRVAPFYSAGIGLNLHNYDFMKSDYSEISLARITANYGRVGKVNFSPYMAYNTYEIITDMWYPTGNGVELLNRSNSDLMWETTDAFNIAIDLGLWNNRLVLGFDFYNKLTNNLISSTTLPSSTGFTSYTNNAGSVRNRGFEFDINASIIHKKDLDFGLSLNGAMNRNRIMNISDTQQAYNDQVIAYLNETSSESVLPMLQYVEGGSLTSIFGVQSLGISPATGNEIYVDSNGNIHDEWDASYLTIIGDTEADVNGSFSINLRYKKLTLFTTFLYEFGGDLYNSTLLNNVECVDLLKTNADSRVMTDRWYEEGDISQMKRIDLFNNTYTQSTSRFVQTNNYVKFNSVSLGYTIDAPWVDQLGISMLKVQASMNDILTLSTVKQERGLSYPFARTVNLSVNVSF